MRATTIAAPASRVALLARPGIACERLQAALRDAGAQVVLVADPAQADEATVRATGAQAVLIALEPTLDVALDRYDALLADPQITVIFDEADLAAQREGWDAARWSRHLAAKLGLQGDVLPPGADTDGLADSADADEVSWDPPARYQRLETELDLSSFAVGEAATVVFDIPRDDLQRAAVAGDAVQGDAVQDDAVQDYPAQDSASRTTGVRFDDPDAAFEPDRPDHPAVSDRFLQELEDLQAHAATLDLPEPAAKAYGSGTLAGAVVVLAGIGGPDAVRQLLAAIPAGFPRPILIQQRLDGGQHEKLVRQMQRATKLNVRLAVAGETAQPGHVYVLPTAMLPEPEDTELRFRDSGDGSLPAFIHLPPGDSAVVMLSGSDPAMVDAAMTHSWGGALVVGQSPEGCFDGIAASALLARGASSGAPAALARQLSMRWLSLKD